MLSGGLQKQNPIGLGWGSAAITVADAEAGYKHLVGRQVVAWDGDANEPVWVDGTTLTVPVERHNFRLLVVEKK